MCRLGGIKRGSPPGDLFFSFFPQLLFAFWLRSSVVPVLISLIADSPALQDTPINPIFRTRDLASLLAYASLHRVTGLTLLLVDANTLFVHQLFGLPGYLEKEVWFGSTTMEPIYLSCRYAIQLYHPPTNLSHL